MDIQIPALAWSPRGPGWARIYRLGATAGEVTVPGDQHALRFQPDRDLDTAQRRLLTDRLAGHFPRQVASLRLDAAPALKALHQRYSGTIIMRTTPFEALVLTVLSQNRTGEI